MAAFSGKTPCTPEIRAGPICLDYKLPPLQASLRPDFHLEMKAMGLIRRVMERLRWGVPIPTFSRSIIFFSFYLTHSVIICAYPPPPSFFSSHIPEDDIEKEISSWEEHLQESSVRKVGVTPFFRIFSSEITQGKYRSLPKGNFSSAEIRLFTYPLL